MPVVILPVSLHLITTPSAYFSQLTSQQTKKEQAKTLDNTALCNSVAFRLSFEKFGKLFKDDNL